MAKQKTAMQRLIDYMKANFHLTEDAELEFIDSLEAEEQQIKQSFEDGQSDCTYNESEGILHNSSSDEYYKNKFDNSVVS